MSRVISVSRTRREILFDERPSSKREIMAALLHYWRTQEPDFPMTEVCNYPNELFFEVKWA